MHTIKYDSYKASVSFGFQHLMDSKVRQSCPEKLQDKAKNQLQYSHSLI